jgi:hypothetical protein
MNEYSVIFERTQGGLLAAAIGHGVVIAGLFVWGFVSVIRSRRRGEKNNLGPCLVVGGILWAVFHLDALLYVARDYGGPLRVTEGVVHVTHQQPYSGHSSGDKLTVNGEPFTVDYFYATAGYRQTIARGGVLRDGVHARLTHGNGVILKVEVRKSTP